MSNTGKRSASERDSLTMNDLLAEQLQLEEEANHNISEHWGDEGICTYLQGYLSQNIYACATCQGTEGRQEVFGFCYGCSLECHLNHEVYELFNKRNFRCDCGVTQCGDCKLTPKSEKPKNSENKYNHNFKGLYCFCNKVYNPEEDEMLQCFMCQDWFHVECIDKFSGEAVQKQILSESNQEKNTETNANENSLKPSASGSNPTGQGLSGAEQPNFLYLPYERESTEMICYECMEKHSFLYKYLSCQVIPIGLKNTITIPKLQWKKEESEGESKCNCPDVCIDSIPRYSTFWHCGWRANLCKCESCCSKYKEENIEYLLEIDEASSPADSSPQNTITTVNLDQLTTRTLENIPLEQRHEISRGFNMLTNELKLFLEPLKENGTIVTKEHIEQFFKQFDQKKRKFE